MIVLQSSSIHDNPEMMADFAAGRLKGAVADAAEHHINECTLCAAKLDTVPADEFIASLRAAYPLSGIAAEGIPAGLVNHPRYRITGLLGKGGMGAVYRAKHLLMGRTVALKCIASKRIATPGVAERFRQEVRAAARLIHDNIVTAYDAEAVGPMTVLVMECVEGQTLAERLHERGPLSAEEACEYVRQAAVGLAYAHTAGTIHRDLKPQNLILDTSGTVKILDFGLARFISDECTPETSEETLCNADDGLTEDGAVIGTREYMPPEQASDPRQANAQSDIYALGATLTKLLTGQIGKCNGPPPLAAICRRAMALNPADRYASAQDFAEDLARLQCGQAVMAYPESRPIRLKRLLRRHRRLTIAAGVILVLCSLATVLIVSNRDAERRAAAARATTRETLDAMVSGVTGDALEAQPVLTTAQKKFLESVISRYEEFAADPGTEPQGPERVAAAQYQLALIRHRLGQNREAVEAYGQAAERYAALAEASPHVTAYQQQLAYCHNSRGVDLRLLGRFTEAESEFIAALDLQKQLMATDTESTLKRHDAAIMHYNYGHLLALLHRYKDSEKAYDTALNLLKALVSVAPGEPRHRFALGLTHNGIGNLVSELGRTSDAESAYLAARSLHESLARQFPAVAAYRLELARTHNNLAILYGDTKRPAEAVAAYQAALAHGKQLSAESPGVPDYRNFVSLTHSNLGVQFMDMHRYSEAEEHMQAAEAGQIRLVADDPNIPANRQELARTRNNYGNLLDDLGRLTDAETVYRAALLTRTELVKEYPGMTAYQRDLANTTNNLANILVRLDRLSEAETEFRNAIRIYEPLTRTAPQNPDTWRDLARTHNNLGNLLRRLGRAPEANVEFRISLELRAKLATPVIPQR